MTPMMMDAMAQAPARVAQELTKTGPMMRRDEVSIITCIRRSHVWDQSGCRCRLASLTETCCTEHDAVEQLPQRRGTLPARLRRAVSWRARLPSSNAEKYRRACAVRQCMLSAGKQVNIATIRGYEESKGRAHRDDGEGQLDGLQDVEPLVEHVQLVGLLGEQRHQQRRRQRHQSRQKDALPGRNLRRNGAIKSNC